MCMIHFFSLNSLYLLPVQPTGRINSSLKERTIDPLINVAAFPVVAHKLWLSFVRPWSQISVEIMALMVFDFPPPP